MIKQNEISEINVDDFIWQERRRGKKSIRWISKNIKILRVFAREVYKFEGFFLPPDFPKQGQKFMGIKHYTKIIK